MRRYTGSKCVKLENSVAKQFPAKLMQRLSEVPGAYQALFHVSKIFDSTWDNMEYVRLPTSSEFRFQNSELGKWAQISEQLLSLKDDCLSGKFENASQLLSARMKTIFELCSETKGRYNFAVLTSAGVAAGAVDSIPGIVDAALRLPVLIQDQIPILCGGQNKTLYLTKGQAWSLLANGFFSTFPHPWDDMPTFNFAKLFHANESSSDSQLKEEKVLCLLYFKQMNFRRSYGNEDLVLSYQRRHNSKKQDWSSLKTKLVGEVGVEVDQKIEEADGMLQVSFANRIIGGGVLGNGGVMEEIRFATSPELMLARLFTLELVEDEVIIVTGTEQFSRYQGYSSSFRFQGPVPDASFKKIDNLGRTMTQVVLMDAVKFDKYKKAQQFNLYFLNRKLHKAFVAFTPGSHLFPVATGNWGCGAFNGNPELKFVIQWMAASQAGKQDIIYRTLGDTVQALRISEVVAI